MTRRNVKQRAVAKTAPVNTEKAKEKNFLEEFAYTKTEINRMSTADLKELAKEKVNIYINDMNNIGVSYEDAIKYLQELGGNK